MVAASWSGDALIPSRPEISWWQSRIRSHPGPAAPDPGYGLSQSKNPQLTR